MTPPTAPDDPVWADLSARLAGAADPLPVLREDQARRWASGDRVPVEEYVRRFPAVGAEDALVLILAEAGLRQARGEAPAAAEYQARFPHLAADLALHFQFHDQLAGRTWTAGGPAPGETRTQAPLAGRLVDGPVAGAPPLARAGEYEVLESLGRGGMGEVFKARQAGLNRVVALKVVLGGDRAGPKELIRFLAEAEAVAAVKHPNVVQVFEYGERDGRPFLALEYLPGGSLADRLKATGKLDPRAAAELVRKLAVAVQAAHDRGIVHRDLKPANVLFDEAGEPRVTDFGLAKRAGGSDLTATNAVMGTPAYMSPEQARGETKFVGPAADVWALGVVLFECLTGRRPFDHPDPIGLLRLVAEADPPAPRRVVPGLSRDLDLVCRKCLQKDPLDRYQSAVALADDLGRFLDGRPVAARPLGPAARAWRWARRNPRAAGLVGSVAGLLVVVAVGSATAAALLRAERDTARKAERDARAAEGRATAADRERRQELFRAYLGEARAVRVSGRMGQRFRGLDALRKVLDAIPADELSPDQRVRLRDEAIACLALSDVRPVARRAVRSATYFDVDCDDRFETLVTADDPGLRTVVRPPGGAEPVALDPVPADLAPRYSGRRLSPDGRWLAEAYFCPTDPKRHLMRVWDVAAGKPVVTRWGVVNWAHQFDFHPTRPEFCFAGLDNRIRVIDLTTGSVVRESDPRYGGARLRYSPDGRTLAVTSNVSWAQLVDAGTLTPSEPTPLARDTDSVAWSPDGRTVAFGTLYGRVYLWDRRVQGGRVLPGEHQGSVVSVQFAPDGLTLATVGSDNQTRLWDPHQDRSLVAVPGRLVRFAPDGRLAVVDDADFVVYEAAGRDGVRILRGAAEGAEFSPDGSLLAIFGPGGARLLAADTLEHMEDLRVDECGAVAFRPDGRGLVTVTRFTGAWVWPVRTAPAGTTVGPPAPLFPDQELAVRWAFSLPVNDGRQAAWSRDGSLLVLPDRRGQKVQQADADGKTRPRVFAPLDEPQRLAVSPDGRWVAGGTTAADGTRVWDRAGVAVLEVPGHPTAAFSPDDRWLATGGRHEVRIYRVGTWEPVRTFRRAAEDADHLPALAFQPGTGRLAYLSSRQLVGLVDPETGELAATLTHPEPVAVVRLSFSPDGTRLAVTRAGTDVVYWDLRRVSDGLANAGLDVGVPLTPPGPQPGRPGPVRVDRGTRLPPPTIAHDRCRALAAEEAARGNFSAAVVDITQAIDTAPADPKTRAALFVLRGQYHWRSGATVAARDDWQAALGLVPDSREASTWMARIWVLGPADVRDPARALALIFPYAEGADSQAQSVLVLGVAQARLGRHREALATFNRLSGKTKEPVRAYFQAVCLFHLGEKQAARDMLAAARLQDEVGAKNRGVAESDEVAVARAAAEEVVK